jgi:DNA-binding GntR family transcriptional regulator
MIRMDDKPEYMTKRSRVVAILRRAIAAGVYQPGQRLRQDEIAETLHLSLTPVREAFSQLAAEGILKHVPHKGVTVAGARASPESIREIYRIRSALEGLAVELAVPNLQEEDLSELESLQRQMDELVEAQNLEGLRQVSYEFHILLYAASKSPQLIAMIETIWARFPWGDQLLRVPGMAQQSAKDHEKLLCAAKEGKPRLCAEVMVEHIKNAGEIFNEYISQTES